MEVVVGRAPAVTTQHDSESKRAKQATITGVQARTEDKRNTKKNPTLIRECANNNKSNESCKTTTM